MDPIQQLQDILSSIQNTIPFTLVIILILFAIQIVNRVLGNRLNYLGIYPRNAFGLIGIIFSPFLHGDFSHLLFNCIPLFSLMNLVLLQGNTIFYYVTLFIILVSGLLVWIFGRKAIHIGASSLIVGYWSYLLMNMFNQGIIMAFILGVFCIYYFGGIFFSMFPTDKAESWEGHLAGFIAGILASYVCTPAALEIIGRLG